MPEPDAANPCQVDAVVMPLSKFLFSIIASINWNDYWGQPFKFRISLVLSVETQSLFLVPLPYPILPLSINYFTYGFPFDPKISPYLFTLLTTIPLPNRSLPILSLIASPYPYFIWFDLLINRILKLWPLPCGRNKRFPVDWFVSQNKQSLTFV